MGYLRYRDYLPTIQDGNFQQVLQSIDSYRIITEERTKAQMISYLVQKYDVDSEFTDTSVFSYTATYTGASRVELNFPSYSATSTYALNALVTYNGVAYICKTAITVAEPFDAAKWNVVGTQYDLLYIDLPYPLFNLKAYYLPGDRVYWRGKCYECKLGTIPPSHNQQIQADKISDFTAYNFFPDDSVNGVKSWGTGIPYQVSGFVPGATAPAAWSSSTAYAQGQTVTFNGLVWLALRNSTNSEPGKDIEDWQSQKWITGDNRNAQLVEYMVAMTIMKLSSRIAPRNVPQHWLDKYNEAVAWLQMAADGSVTAAIITKQPSQGARIRYGGKPQLDNYY